MAERLVLPFQVDDIEALCDLGGHSETAAISEEVWHRIEEAELGWTLWVDGERAAIGGIVPHWPGRAEVWTVMGQGLGLATIKHWTRRLIRYLDKIQAEDPERFRRVEAWSRADNPEGQRWLLLMGFEPEGTLRRYAPDGADAIMFSRIGEG